MEEIFLVYIFICGKASYIQEYPFKKEEGYFAYSFKSGKDLKPT
jgi:hypothetical protein